MSHHQHLWLTWRVLGIHRGRCCIENFSSEQAVFSMTHLYDCIVALPEATVVSEKPTVIRCTCEKSFVSSSTPRPVSGCLCPLGTIVGQANALLYQNSAAQCESKSADRCLTSFHLNKISSVFTFFHEFDRFLAHLLFSDPFSLGQ